MVRYGSDPPWYGHDGAQASTSTSSTLVYNVRHNVVYKYMRPDSAVLPTPTHGSALQAHSQGVSGV